MINLVKNQPTIQELETVNNTAKMLATLLDTYSEKHLCLAIQMQTGCDADMANKLVTLAKLKRAKESPRTGDWDDQG
jgi:hypothetical protein